MANHSKIQLMKQETIVAIATPPGRGGVGIIRLSGPLSLTIAEKLSSKPLSTLKPRQVLYTQFVDKKKNMLDDGVLLYFKAPHSFTGEEIIEFQCHGSPVVLDSLVSLYLTYGARLAYPGEFSQRAFLNEKMDLTQAEAVSDLINASSKTAARMAIKSLQGEFSKQINALNDQIIRLRVYVEASLDFSDEDIDFIAEGKIAEQLTVLMSTLNHIYEQAMQGVLLREGLSIVIAGAPNAGKSTLINRLAGRDVAIVTEIPGTTRDVMREHIVLDDLPLHIMDTAGLRDSDDRVEQEGIKRALEEIKQADCILWVSDVQNCTDDYVKQSTLMTPHVSAMTPVIHVMNKIDAVGKPAGEHENKIFLSAQSGEGIALLKIKIKKQLGYQPSEGLFSARRRHLAALDRAKKFLQQAEQQLISLHAVELLAEDFRQAHQALAEITGEFSSDDLLGEIFSTFCIGK